MTKLEMEHLKLLIELHAEIELDRGCEDEDDIRDKMDVTWYEMSDESQKSMREMSSFLYNFVLRKRTKEEIENEIRQNEQRNREISK